MVWNEQMDEEAWSHVHVWRSSCCLRGSELDWRCSPRYMIFDWILYIFLVYQRHISNKDDVHNALHGLFILPAPALN